MEEVIVLGSINMDLVTLVDRKPFDGETITGKRFFTANGGKGANQAVSIAKLEKRVTLLGKVGSDSFGKELLENLNKQNVDTKYIETEASSSGLATIIVDSKGENSIIVVPGANEMVDIKYVEKNSKIFSKGKNLLCQLEIPLETIKYAFSLAKENGMKIILNPAPATEKMDDLLKLTDILICNETEFDILTESSSSSVKDIEKNSNIILEKGVKDLIVTLGSKGVLYINANTKSFYKAYKVEAVDTTAAGDSFIGGFLSFLNMGFDYAIDMGMKAGAIAVTRLGAQSSLASLEEVENFGK